MVAKYSTHRLRVVREVCEDVINYNKSQSVSSKVIFDLFRDYCNRLDREEFIVVTLNVKLQINGWSVVSQGTLNTTMSHPREVFKVALLNSAHAIILLHNHPSGDCQPSEGDALVTSRMIESGRILGIEVADHIIIGNNLYYSFADHGRMRGI